MPDALIIDTPGGSNFAGHDLRNVGSLHVGGTSLPIVALEVTGTARFNGAVEFVTGISTLTFNNGGVIANPGTLLSVTNPNGIARISSTQPGGITQIGPINNTSVTIGAGTDGKVSFFGNAPLVQQDVTGSTGGNVALQSLLARLNAIGLINDSTT